MENISLETYFKLILRDVLFVLLRAPRDLNLVVRIPRDLFEDDGESLSRGMDFNGVQIVRVPPFRLPDC